MDLDDIQTITVLGAGTMGHGIAEVAALAGYDVRLRDIEEEIVQDGYDQIEWSLNKLAENDRIPEEQAASALENVSAHVDLAEAVDDADVVIEAIIEEMDIKQQVYDELDEVAPDRTIFASNTSSLSITDLSEVTDRAEQFCGMHFFNPPVRMDLVEVIRGAHTNDETMDVVEALAEDMGKEPVRVRKDSPGFIVNRVLVPLMNEACWMVEDGDATVEEVDATTAYEVGLPMGAFELGDQVGNDVTLHVLDYMYEVLGEPYAPCPLLERTVDEDRLGKKTGEGFYEYEDGPGAEYAPDAAREEIATRLLASVANEVGKLRENDVAPVDDIDHAVKLGGAWPEGPAKLADEHGLDDLIAVLEERHEETGAARYEVAAGLRAAAEEGGFHGGNDDGGEDTVDFETIRLEYPSENVGQVVLDRPQQMNTVSPQMLEEFSAALDELEADDDVRCVLIRGAGDRAFCAGADAVGMAGSAEPLAAVELGRNGAATWGELEELSMPVVAAIDGYALGGGMELATCADMRIATDRSTFGQPEHDLGIMPGWGGTQRLKHIVGEGRAKEIIFTCDQYDAETMYDYGFVNEVVDPAAFEDRALELAEDLAAGPPVAQEYTKKVMLTGRDDTEAGLEAEAQAFGHLIGTEDFFEGVAKFRSDEDPEFEGK
jgi:enoyl-CoA hydratase/3-hydroxyacyl-CoA dehydrogenase